MTATAAAPGGSDVKTYRIFLSSPGDVAAERKDVRELLLGLARGPFVRGRLHIDVVSWDDPHAPAAMDARYTPQQAVDRGLPMPADCDLTVVLQWGRMGTQLTEKKPDGTRYLSGTEWEFNNALGADRPVLVYRRSEKVLLDPDDADFDEKVVQKRRADAFFRQFVGAGGTIERATAAYATVEDLKTRVRLDVEHYLAAVLEARELEPAGDGRAGRPSARGGRPEVPVAYREWRHGRSHRMPTALHSRMPRCQSTVVLLAVILAAALTPDAWPQGAARMSRTAKGSFTVEMKPLADPDAAAGVSLGRMSLDKRFDGDLVATSRGTILTALTPVKESAGYVAMERVTGTLHGRSGSFVFQHSATMNRGAQQLSITVVPDSGTGELAGLSGTFTLTIVEGKHLYEFEYSLPE